MKKKLSKSIKKYIRKEKSRIRRGNLNLEEKERLIKGLYKKSSSSPADRKVKATKTSKKTSSKKSSSKKTSSKKSSSKKTSSKKSSSKKSSSKKSNKKK